MSHRLKMPRRSDFIQLYTHYKISKYEPKDLNSMFNLLRAKVTKLVAENEDYSVEVQQLDDEENTPFILAITTLLMKEVHNMASENSLTSHTRCVNT